MTESPSISLLNDCRKTWRPPPQLKVSEWAEEFRRIATESSPMPGRWHNDVTPYLVDVMDWLNDPEFHTCVFMKPSRAGATEAGINMKGYRAHLDPCHILYAQTSEGEVGKYVKKIFDPAIKATPILRSIIGDTKTRNAESSTTFLKMFPGGSINLIGGSSPKGFRMVACPFVIGDDIDGMPDDVDGEGDPIELLISRAKNFWDRKIYLASTTTVKGQSRIDKWFQDSDKRYFFVPCQNPKCKLHTVTKQGGGFKFEWSRMKWDKDRPETARYLCPDCGFAHENDRHKRAMLAGGVWRATSTSNGIAGFHLNRMYSPFVPWSEMVEDWLKAKGNVLLLKVFINHQLAEPWEEDDVIELDDERLFNSRRESYPVRSDGVRLVPRGVLCVTAGVDVQHDRFEVEFVGWGLNGESWGLGYHTIPCDTSIQSNYDDNLDPLWTHTFQLENGINLRVVSVAIDSGDGARTTEVYKYCYSRYDNGIFAIKGRGGAGIPLASNPTKQKIDDLTRDGEELSIRIFIIGTDAGKSALFTHLKKDKVGPGYCHFPMEYTRNYFEMLTAEKSVLRKVRGKMKRVFEKIRSRNEALDIRVYAMAALAISGADLELCRQFIERAILDEKHGGQNKTTNTKPKSRVISEGLKL